MTIPADMDVMQRREKKLKYKIFCTEIQRMLRTKCMIKPVITAATGIVTKGLKLSLETISGKHSTDSLPKIATFGNMSHNAGQQADPNDAVVRTDRLSRNVDKLLATYTAQLPGRAKASIIRRRKPEISQG